LDELAVEKMELMEENAGRYNKTIKTVELKDYCLPQYAF